MKRYLWIGGLVLAFAGIGLTVFLTWAHFNGSIARLCGEGAACQSVLTSSYATIAGLPTALYGLLFYVTVFLLLLVYPLTTGHGRTYVLNGILATTSGGFVVSLLLMAYSMFGLNSFCLYCGSSFALVTLLFMGTVFWRIRGGREEEFTVNNVTTWQGLSTAAGVAVLVLFVLTAYFYQRVPQEQEEQAFDVEKQALVYDQRAIGAPGAPVRVIEFFDLECPACQNFTNRVFPKIKKEFIDQGQVVWTFRYFPLPRHHKHALEAHTALSMAPPSSYLDVKKKIMRNANRWVSKSVSSPTPFLQSVLSEHGLKNVVFPEKEMRSHLLRRRNAYSRMGIRSTPSFLVNGELVEGGKPISFWRDKVNELLPNQ